MLFHGNQLTFMKTWSSNPEPNNIWYIEMCSHSYKRRQNIYLHIHLPELAQDISELTVFPECAITSVMQTKQQLLKMLNVKLL